MQLLAKIAVRCEAIATQGFINDDFKKSDPFSKNQRRFYGRSTSSKDHRYFLSRL
jgi:hypothetical protein